MKRYFDEYKAALLKHQRAKRAADDAQDAVTMANDEARAATRAVEDAGNEVLRALDALTAALLKVSK